MDVRQTPEFAEWFRSLKDLRAAGRVLTRIRRLELGNPGDVKPVGGGVGEMRIDYGPGYRLYFIQRRDVVALLLCGGDKRTQRADIRLAKALAENWTEDR